MTTLYRPHGSTEWREVEIVCAGPLNTFICREADRILPGIFVAHRNDLRQIAGVIHLRRAA